MKYKILALSIALFSLYGCKEENKKQGFKPQTPAVTFVELKESNIEINKDFKGKVEPFMLSEIRPQVTGIIISKEFEDGAHVKKNQILYKIDNSQYKAIYHQNLASLNNIKADLDNAKLKFDRYSVLLKEKAISKQEKEEAEFNYKKLLASVEERKANLAISKINLDYTEIKAPIDGFIGISNITKGSLVTSNQVEKINTVTALSPIYIDINQTTNEFFEMKNTTEKFGISKPLVSLTDLDFSSKGEIISNNVNVDSNTNSVKIRAKFENIDNKLLPGMYVNLNINYGNNPNGLIIPQKSVSFNAKGNPYVFLVKEKENKPFVEIKEIKIGSAINSDWIVEEGLKAGDKVVFDGFDKVKSGEEVIIENKGI